MPISESQFIVLGVYTIIFLCIVGFFEARLNYMHRRHIEKLWPIGEDGLRFIDRKVTIITRIIFSILFILSVATIITLL